MQYLRIRCVVWIGALPDVAWLFTRLPTAQRIEQDSALNVGAMGQAQAVAQGEADWREGAWWPHLA